MSWGNMYEAYRDLFPEPVTVTTEVHWGSIAMALNSSGLSGPNLMLGVAYDDGSAREFFYRETTEHREARGFRRALESYDPFQNGAHTTMPAWYVGRQLARFEV